MMKKLRICTAFAAVLLLTGCGAKPDFNAAVEAIKEPFDAEFLNSDGEPCGYWDKYIKDNLDLSEDGSTLTFKFNNVDFHTYYEHYKDDSSAWETTLTTIMLASEYDCDVKLIEMLNAQLGVPETVLDQINKNVSTFESSMNTTLSQAGGGDSAQKLDQDHVEFTEECKGFTVSYQQDKEDIVHFNAVLTYTVS